MCAESRSGDDVTVMTVHGRVISRVKRRVLSVPIRILLQGIRVVVGETSTVSGSRRIIPNTPPEPKEGLGRYPPYPRGSLSSGAN